MDLATIFFVLLLANLGLTGIPASGIKPSVQSEDTVISSEQLDPQALNSHQSQPVSSHTESTPKASVNPHVVFVGGGDSDDSGAHPNGLQPRDVGHIVPTTMLTVSRPSKAPEPSSKEHSTHNLGDLSSAKEDDLGQHSSPTSLSSSLSRRDGEELVVLSPAHYLHNIHNFLQGEGDKAMEFPVYTEDGVHIHTPIFAPLGQEPVRWMAHNNHMSVTIVVMSMVAVWAVQFYEKDFFKLVSTQDIFPVSDQEFADTIDKVILHGGKFSNGLEYYKSFGRFEKKYNPVIYIIAPDIPEDLRGNEVYERFLSHKLDIINQKLHRHIEVGSNYFTYYPAVSGTVEDRIIIQYSPRQPPRQKPVLKLWVGARTTPVYTKHKFEPS